MEAQREEPCNPRSPEGPGAEMAEGCSVAVRSSQVIWRHPLTLEPFSSKLTGDHEALRNVVFLAGKQGQSRDLR